MAWSLRFYGDGISFWVVLSPSFWLRVLPGGACLVQPRWMPERRILGGGQTGGVSFWPFLDSSVWWRLISSLFLPGPPVVKLLMQIVYYGAWPGWVVSISVLPLTLLLTKSVTILMIKPNSLKLDFIIQEKKKSIYKLICFNQSNNGNT